MSERNNSSSDAGNAAVRECRDGSRDTRTAERLAAVLAALSHDMRATLNGMSVWTHIIERHADETTARAVEGIRRAVTQQAQLATELSDFGRAVSAQGWPERRELADVLGEAVDETQKVRDKKGIELRMPPALPRIAAGALAVHTVVRWLLADLLTRAGDGASIVVTAGATDEHVVLRFALSDEDGRRIGAHFLGSRQTLRDALVVMVAGMHGIELAFEDDDRLLRMPRA